LIISNSTIFVETLLNEDITFATGVPDSLLAPVSAILESEKNISHVSAVNEGSAISIAMGHYLGTGKIPLVYLQNSGLGNIVNPYTSLLHPDVYGIPVLLLIGWRGLIPDQDEPQHRFQGSITKEMLSLLEIPFFEIENESQIAELTSLAIKKIKGEKKSSAILVHPNIFKDSKLMGIPVPVQSRYLYISKIYELLPKSSNIISTTGKTSRELDEIHGNKGLHNIFLTVGGMGHCASIAIGLSLSQPEKMIYCLDGDGAMQMHLGALGTIGNLGMSNFAHFLFNNGVHESVGGQTVSNSKLNYAKIALACGYRNVKEVNDLNDLETVLIDLKNINGPILIIINLLPGSSDKLGRPDGKPVDWKKIFMEKFSSSRR
jgi:phosphonopyruvate decarboxylase